MNLALRALFVCLVCVLVNFAQHNGVAVADEDSGKWLGKTFCAVGGADSAAEIWSKHGWKSRYYFEDCTLVWLHLVEDYCTELLDDDMERNELTSQTFSKERTFLLTKGCFPAT